ncbi:MAG: response regulator [Actinobacteria bacterium]|nr:response regulator [Actinomycetota bacterium]
MNRDRGLREEENVPLDPGDSNAPSGSWKHEDILIKDEQEHSGKKCGNKNGDLDEKKLLEFSLALKKGDFDARLPIELTGLQGKVADTLNDVAGMIGTVTAEVNRIGKAVGKEGRMGEKVDLSETDGSWGAISSSVNTLIDDLGRPVREISRVLEYVANGNLSKTIALEMEGIHVEGEFLRVAVTVNTLVDKLNTFVSEVTRVAKEVGTEGILGGQAAVPDIAGSWKDLVNNVNMLANNWATQVRAISDVVTAVTKGDLSQKITVDARGEVKELRDNINTMITNIRTTTLQNEEQYWLKKNLAKFTVMLQGQNDLDTVAQTLMSELAPVVNAQHGVFYLMEADGNEHNSLRLLASYACKERKNLAMHFEIGEGLVGQCACEKQRILLTNVPGDYIQITSGLGESTPLNLIMVPVMFEGDVKAVIELASFNLFSQASRNFLEQLSDNLGVVLNTIEANMRTEQLLEQSQSMSRELQSQSADLKQANEELEEKARMLEQQKQEIEEAKLAVEEKAKQLALTSKYKSQFLSSMSHELRTPLNTLLLLARQLGDNPEGNLSDKQVDFANTILQSGNDLLTLITDILDISKIESGTVTVENDDVVLADLKDEIERMFKPSADSSKLGFSVKIDDKLPLAIRTDGQRLRQVLKNLISNALKFTETGGIDLEIVPVEEGWRIDNADLNRADMVIAFTVKDTGIGIAKDQQKVVFEAFRQVNGTTRRKYGGTGLGLYISRELAQLLGGDLGLTSTPGKGSTITLYLKQNYSDISGENKKNNITDNHEEQKDKLSDICVKDVCLKGKTVLIVDDDIRSIFALTSVLERYGMDVKTAGSAEDAIARLEENDGVGAVLMDVMMPGTDGYEAMRRIRELPEFASLPIVAVTAKAMNGDKEKCINAGASDYIAKPVDTDQLLSLLRVWL